MDVTVQPGSSNHDVEGPRHRKPTAAQQRAAERRREKQQKLLRSAVEHLSDELRVEKSRADKLAAQRERDKALWADITRAEAPPEPEPEPLPPPVPSIPLWARVIRRLGVGALAVFVVGALVVAAAIAFVPAVANATTMKVLSGSMSGTFSKGDVVVSKPIAPEKVEIGDVITFKAQNVDSTRTETVTHRVVEILTGAEGPEFVTKGDANVTNDVGIVTASDLKGKLWYHVPYAGKARDNLFAPQAMFYGGAVLMLLVGAHLLRPGRHQTTGRPAKGSL